MTRHPPDALEADCHEAMGGRLLRNHPRPVAVALSGGGDSVALTVMAKAWADAAGRPLLVLHVDHAIQSDGAVWAQGCRALAERLGCGFQALRWDGAKPAAGLPAAARRARHRLLADAARTAGARVILMAHTADDRAEAEAMRAQGATTPEPRSWAPSPVWPEGRGVFLLRPLLNVRRADLRAWLSAQGEGWIEDPANSDRRYARARVRADGIAKAPTGSEVQVPLALAAKAEEWAGMITMPRADLRAADAQAARRALALAAVCAGGGDRLPSGASALRVLSHIVEPGPFVGSLAGARVEASSELVRVYREAGEAGRGGLAPLRPPGVWDGRFEIAEGVWVRALGHNLAALSADEQAAARGLPARARHALPVVVDETGRLRCPPLAGHASLVGERFRAAAGLVQGEPA